MRFTDILRTAFMNLWRRKLRAVLTVLGMVIGVASIVVMMSLGIGIRKSTIDSYASMGSLTNITVSRWSYKETATGGTSTEKKLDKKAVETIKKIPGVKAVMPQIQTYGILKSGKWIADCSIMAIDSSALTEAQLTKLDTSKLEAVESKIAELENDQVVAKSVEDAINALPELADMTAEKVADVTLVGVQFDALSDAQKSLISDAAKTKLEELRAWQPEDPTVYGDVDGDGEVTVTDALMVLQHSVGKITLADSVLKNADVDGEAGITVADALAILQASVNKVSLPFVKEA